MVFKYFVLISNNNTYVSSRAILWHVNIKHSKLCNEKDF